MKRVVQASSDNGGQFKTKYRRLKIALQSAMDAIEECGDTDAESKEFWDELYEDLLHGAMAADHMVNPVQ